MTRYLLDTDTCIYLINKRPWQVQARFEKHPAEQCAISVITHLELAYGAAKSREPEQTLAASRQFLAALDVLEFTFQDAVAAGWQRAELERRGQPIGSYDLQIAAQALTRDLILVTNNLREFKRVPGLKLENWVAAGVN